MRNPLLCLTLLCLFAVMPQPAHAARADYFGNRLPRSVGGSPFGMASGDFDEDGRPDLVVTNLAGSVSILRTTGPILGNVSNYPTQGVPIKAAVGDFNADGHDDVAASLDGGLHSFVVFRGNGQGALGPALVFSAGAGTPYGVAAADFNADGLDDVALAAFGTFSVVVSLALPPDAGGNPRFAPPQSYAAGESPYDIVAADLSGDGILDLAVGNQNSGNVSVLLGNGAGGQGNGTFSSPLQYPTGTYSYGVAAGHLDGDARLDLVAINGGSATLSVMLDGPAGDPSRPLLAAVNIPLPAGDGRSVGIVDLDRDGASDIVVASFNGKVVVLFGYGDGTFASSLEFEIGAGATEIVLEDFDLDGCLDAAVTNLNAPVIELLLGNCGSVVPYITDLVPQAGRVGDAVEIFGSRLFDAFAVKFNGVAATFQIVGAGHLTAVVPAGATPGPVTVETPGGTATSPHDFFVGETPVILAVAPEAAKRRTAVTVTGQHFSGATRVAFGPQSHATFTVDSDEQITAVVDSAATTGPISITTPVATGTSGFDFVVVPFDTGARIVSVRDVPRDQGGRVVVRWLRSDLDTPGDRYVVGYRVWRRAPLDPAGALTGRAAPAGWRRGVAGANASAYWEPLTFLPPGSPDGYACIAPTTEDSTGESNVFTAFFVQTLTADAFLFHTSPIDSGYSVDNLPPNKPPKFNADYSDQGVTLRWGGSAESDFREYRLYRGPTVDFVPGASTLLYAGPDTSMIHGETGGCFKVSAVDIHGNESRHAVATPSGSTTGVALAVSVVAEPTRVTLTWYLPAPAGGPITIYRRTEGHSWSPVASLVSGANGLVRYVDESVAPGTSVAYRLGVVEEEVEVLSDEVWVRVPEARLALLSVGPNPMRAGDGIRIRLALPAAGRTLVRLFDLAGRAVFRDEFSTASGGIHERRLDAGASLAPGVYWLRVAYGGQAVATRVAVLD